ncbi:MAG TPA: DUF4150 domain-containing protein [Polyangiales bacterium]|nr:DUF4150 domain-containing protein [Polyangiales bacterium]
MTNVFANSRSIVHSGSGQTQVAAPPDVCKTPVPGGPPVPVPYVNSAKDAQLANGSKRTTIGGHPIALEDSYIALSTGDEPGTAGGIISSKVKGKLTWASSSPNVRVEGKGVVRFMDVTQHNGNSFNTAFIQNGGTGFAYADDFTGACPVCGKGPNAHAVLEKTDGSLEIAMAILKDLKALDDAYFELEHACHNIENKLRTAVARRTTSPLSNAALDKLKADLLEATQKCEAAGGHRREDSNGYMIGVMVCLEGRKFAAISGRELPPEFAKVAKKHQCHVIEKPATVEGILKFNPLSVDGDQRAMEAIEHAWKDAETKWEADVPGYRNKPGTCAGAKLLGTGHLSGSMTELFFAYRPGKGQLQFEAIYRGPEAGAPGDGPWDKPPIRDEPGPKVEKRVKMRRRGGETVTSCKTCQDTLFTTTCARNLRTCGGSAGGGHRGGSGGLGSGSGGGGATGEW